jgi:hypothetical protein
MDLRKDADLEIDILQAMHFTVAAWRQVTQSTIVNCFRKYGYGLRQTESNLNASLKEEEDAFLDDWIRLGAGEDVDFIAYASVDNELATCDFSSTDELFVDRKEDGDEEEEEEDEDERESEAVPSFAEAHAAFQTVKSFFYAHNIGERDEENILNMERVLFDLKRKISTKHLSVQIWMGERSDFHNMY